MLQMLKHLFMYIYLNFVWFTWRTAPLAYFQIVYSQQAHLCSLLLLIRWLVTDIKMFPIWSFFLNLYPGSSSLISAPYYLSMGLNIIQLEKYVLPAGLAPQTSAELISSRMLAASLLELIRLVCFVPEAVSRPANPVFKSTTPTPPRPCRCFHFTHWFRRPTLVKWPVSARRDVIITWQPHPSSSLLLNVCFPVIKTVNYSPVSRDSCLFAFKSSAKFTFGFWFFVWDGGERRKITEIFSRGVHIVCCLLNDVFHFLNAELKRTFSGIKKKKDF